MDCTKCGHPQRQHYVTKDESITGCFLCICHAYVGEERPKRGSIDPDIKKEFETTVIPDSPTWTLELHPEAIEVPYPGSTDAKED